MARLPTLSKYCWVCRSAAAASVNESANVAPCSGSCAMPSTSSGAGMPHTSRIVGARSVTCVNCERSPPASVIRLGPVHDHRVPRTAEVGADLLAPLERRVASPRPGRGVVRVHHGPAPGVQPSVALGELQLHLVGERDAVLHRQLVERAGQRALHAGAVVSPDPEDQGVVELAQLLDRVDDPADVVVGVLREPGVDLHLPRVVRLERLRHVVPGRERLVSRRQLRIGGHDPELPAAARRPPRACGPSPGRTVPCTCRPSCPPRGAARGCTRWRSRRRTAWSRPAPACCAATGSSCRPWRRAGSRGCPRRRSRGSVPMIFWFSAMHGSHWLAPPPRNP